MNDLLKKDLEKLLEAHPELKNRRLVFSENDVVFAKDAQWLPEGGAMTACRIKTELPAVIKGHSPKIEVRKSPVHGYGVFAKETIAEGEFIEEFKMLKLGWRGGYPTDPVVRDYTWGNKNCECIECTTHGVFQYLGLGFGSLYNHSDAPNTKQKLDFKTETMNIRARQRIEKGEELFLSYGDKYFLIRDFWKNIKETKALENAARAKKQLAAEGNKA